jgi:putative ABC transport system permease protein
MGASRGFLARMTLVQALWLAFLGWGIGSGLAALIAFLTAKTELAFFLPWQLLLITGALMAVMCSLAALISIRRIYTLELATLFKR